MEWIFEPWPWYIGGPLVAFCMIALLLAGKILVSPPISELYVLHAELVRRLIFQV